MFLQQQELYQILSTGLVYVENGDQVREMPCDESVLAQVLHSAERLKVRQKGGNCEVFSWKVLLKLAGFKVLNYSSGNLPLY